VDPPDVVFAVLGADHVWVVVQPSGTVTLVFTDVEGSTRLLQELGRDRYLAALEEQRRIVRTACARHDGYEVDTAGDGFFYGFADANEAVVAVEEAMDALARTSIRIRAGIHTGTPGLDPPKYVGEEVHKAARIMGVGHGGQVLLSQATRGLVDGIEARDLGDHRLKDFDEPVRLFQLGSERFPPLKTISNTNLPRPGSSFVGREHEVAEVAALVRDGARLVTLAGPGGSGKTRLAIEAAAELVSEFKAGVFWVGLAGLDEPGLVLSTVAQTLGASGELADHIEEREMLLLLDNFEQVVEAAPELATLIEACRNLRLLVTSRELLRVRGEVDYEVAPLARVYAVELFCARAKIENDPAVGELCGRLDDLPLALELAAARMRVLSPAQILERLGERLDLLRGGRDADPRQQTLRATIDWSHGLLAPSEQQLFARLAVFAGGCTLEWAESVAGADLDTLQSLAEKSLLRHRGGRFWMLETVREYALERLEALGETETLRRRQADLFFRLAETAGFSWEATTPERYDLMRAEQVNLRATLAWALESDPELGLRLMCELERFWLGAEPHEGRLWFGQLLERATHIPDLLRASALMRYGSLGWIDGDNDHGVRHGEMALDIYRRLGDELGIAQLEVRKAVWVYYIERDPAGARELCEKSLATFRRTRDQKGEAEALSILGSIARIEGEYEDYLALNLSAEQVAERAGWTWWQAGCIAGAADAALLLNRPAEAERHARRALMLAQTMGDRRSLTDALALLASAAALGGEPERAGRLFGAIEAESERGRLGRWETNSRDDVVDELSVAAGLDLERGIAEGKALTLDQAIALALRTA
jgi:predicted ATPase/class 3 adenylate cyclase